MTDTTTTSTATARVYEDAGLFAVTPARCPVPSFIRAHEAVHLGVRNSRDVWAVRRTARIYNAPGVAAGTPGADYWCAVERTMPGRDKPMALAHTKRERTLEALVASVRKFYDSDEARDLALRVAR